MALYLLINSIDLLIISKYLSIEDPALNFIKGRMFPCMHCPYVTGYRSTLDKHIRGVHLNIKSTCDQESLDSGIINAFCPSLVFFTVTRNGLILPSLISWHILNFEELLYRSFYFAMQWKQFCLIISRILLSRKIFFSNRVNLLRYFLGTFFDSMSILLDKNSLHTKKDIL